MTTDALICHLPFCHTTAQLLSQISQSELWDTGKKFQTQRPPGIVVQYN